MAFDFFYLSPFYVFGDDALLSQGYFMHYVSQSISELMVRLGYETGLSPPVKYVY